MTNHIQYPMPAGTQPWAVRERHRSRRRKVLQLPRYSVREEIFNGITHGIGAIGAVAALLILVNRASGREETASVGIFSGSMILLYLISCLYHSLKVGRAKKVFQVLDHCTIYLLIAGTYTPITLLAFSHPKGVILCAVTWSVAAIGILMNAIDMRRFRIASMVCYLCLGWMVLLFLPDILTSCTSYELLMLFLGGICYTLGAVLFGLGTKIPYMHGVFHLFCIAGSIFHFLMIYHLL